MELHLVHALVLTHYESSLVTNLSWEEVIAQDFCIQALYCRETKNFLFHSDYQKSEPNEEITKIISILTLTGNRVEIEKQIIDLQDGECEYSAEDVKKHFH